MKVTAVILIVFFLVSVLRHRKRVKKEDKVNNLKRFYPDENIENK